MATFGQGLDGEFKTVDISTNNTVGAYVTAYTCPAGRSAVLLSVSYEGGGTANVVINQRRSFSSGEQDVQVSIIAGGGTATRVSPFLTDPSLTVSGDFSNRIIMPSEELQYSLNDAGPSPRLIAYIFEYF